MDWNEILRSEEAPPMLKPPKVSVRRGAWTCASCIMTLLLVLALLLCLIGFALSQLWQDVRSAPPMERRSLLLAAAIAPSRKSDKPFGVFYQQTFVVEIADGGVVLASSADGQGALSTDDVCELHVLRADGSTRVWTHDFRDATRTQILALPAQDISELFLPGGNQVTITLRDLTPFTYWSQPYYLVYDVPAPTATPSLTLTPKPTDTRTVTRANVVLANSTPIPTTLPTQAPTLAPTPQPTPSDENATGIFAPPNPLWLAGAVLGALGILFLVVLLRRKNPAPTIVLNGWLDLHDNRTHESIGSLDLARYPDGLAIMLDPLRVAPLNGQTFFAAVRPTNQGPQLISDEQEEMRASRGVLEEAVTLQNGAEILIGERLLMEYRNPTKAWNATGLAEL